MKIQDSLERLKFRIESGSWFANEKDIEAYNNIVAFVENHIDNQCKKKEQKFKLYILGISYFLDIYKTSVYDNVPIKELRKFIAKPLDYHIAKFCSDINTKEQMGFYDRLGFCKIHPSLISREITEKEIDILIESIKDPKNLETLFGNSISVQEVESNLKTSFFSFLDD